MLLVPMFSVTCNLNSFILGHEIFSYNYTENLKYGPLNSRLYVFGYNKNIKDC
jgi:hypothetical protein